MLGVVLDMRWGKKRCIYTSFGQDGWYDMGKEECERDFIFYKMTFMKEAGVFFFVAFLFVLFKEMDGLGWVGRRVFGIFVTLL